MTVRHTNWYVITGAPCSGKTSVIRMLEARRFTVVHEVARALIDDALHRGRTLDEIKANAHAFETRILEKKITIESALPANDRVFLDRALPDSIAYFRHTGVDDTAPLAASREYRYKKVFLFERLRFEKDPVRSEDDQAAADLERLLVETYQELGYTPVRVPVWPVADRTDYILNQL